MYVDGSACALVVTAGGGREMFTYGHNKIAQTLWVYTSSAGFKTKELIPGRKDTEGSVTPSVSAADRISASLASRPGLPDWR